MSGFSIFHIILHNDISQWAFEVLKARSLMRFSLTDTSWNPLCSVAYYVWNSWDRILWKILRIQTWMPPEERPFIWGWVKECLWLCLSSPYNSGSVPTHGWMEEPQHFLSVEQYDKNLSMHKKVGLIWNYLGPWGTEFLCQRYISLTSFWHCSKNHLRMVTEIFAFWLLLWFSEYCWIFPTLSSLAYVLTRSLYCLSFFCPSSFLSIHSFLPACHHHPHLNSYLNSQTFTTFK